MGLNFPIVPIYVRDADGCISLKEDFGNCVPIYNFFNLMGRRRSRKWIYKKKFLIAICFTAMRNFRN